MGFLTRGANGVWWLASERHRGAWRRAAQNPQKAQERVLSKILSRNRWSEYGTKHRFDSICSAAEYADRVPLIRYQDCESAMMRIGDGEQNVLTSEKVRSIQPSAGSAAPCKWIPYTDSLQREFSRSVGVWVAQLFRCYPRAAAGPVAFGVR